MRQLFKSRFLVLCITGALLPLCSYAAVQANDSATVQSTWKPQEISYSYMGFTTAYNCDAFEQRMKSILTALGAHPQTKVRATGCDLNRPSRHFFVTITTATPVAVTNETPSETPPAIGKSEQELIDRLGVKDSITREPFAATWKTVDLSRDLRLNLQPGDCELMEGLRDRVLPKLSIKIVSDSVQCMPHQLGIRAPELTVSVLVPVPSADQRKPVA